MSTGLPQAVTIEEGGTGAQTAAAARSSLGIGSAGTYNFYSGSGTLAANMVSANTNYTQSITVTGADPGDVPACSVGWEDVLDAGIVFSQAYCDSVNSVTIVLRNVTGSPITLTSQAFTVIAIPVV